MATKGSITQSLWMAQIHGTAQITFVASLPPESHRYVLPHW